MSALKAIILCVILAAYLVLIEVYSYVVARRFSSMHGNQA